MRKILFALSLFLSSVTSFAGKNSEGINVGYRGFVYVNCLFGNDCVYYGLNDAGGGFFTTHGYQINSHVFLGAGVGFQYHAFEHFSHAACFPYYADVRYDIKQSRVTPFIECKLGYTNGDISGAFASPQFGLRFSLNSSIAINLGLSYAAQQYSYNGYKRVQTTWDHTGNISLGIEF